MTGGYVKVYRQLLDHGLLSSDRFCRFAAWIYLLLRANWKDRDVLWGSNWIRVKRGQLLITQSQLAEQWNWNRKTVTAFLTQLKHAKMLDIKTARGSAIGYTLITICNYEHFQGEGEAIADIGADIGGTLVGQPDGQYIRRKEGKKGKKENTGFAGDTRTIEYRAFLKTEWKLYRDSPFLTDKSDWTQLSKLLKQKADGELLPLQMLKDGWTSYLQSKNSYDLGQGHPLRFYACNISRFIQKTKPARDSGRDVGLPWPKAQEVPREGHKPPPRKIDPAKAQERITELEAQIAERNGKPVDPGERSVASLQHELRRLQINFDRYEEAEGGASVQ